MLSRKIVILLVIFGALFFVLGCTAPAICGDSICSTNEDYFSCPHDCLMPNTIDAISNAIKTVAPSGMTTSASFVMQTNETITSADLSSRTSLDASAIFFGEQKGIASAMSYAGNDFTDMQGGVLNAKAVVLCKQTADALDSAIETFNSDDSFYFPVTAKAYCGDSQPCCVVVMESR